MLIKYELRRAFGHSFAIAFALGVLSGIGGIFSYYSDTRWNDCSAISCFDAWLYCLSVSEGSFYRALFPVIICLPYLPTVYSDRNSYFIFDITSRMPYSRYLIIKTCVGVISATSVVFLTLIFWLCICQAVFPPNLPTTEFNYLPKGAFSHLFVLHPTRYIAAVILLNIITGALLYLLSMALSFLAKNKRTVVGIPFAIYLLFILLSQIKGFSLINPIVLVAPLEMSSCTFYQIILRWVFIMIIGSGGLYYFYRKDAREIL